MVLNKSHEILLMTKGHKIPMEIQHQNLKKRIPLLVMLKKEEKKRITNF